MKARIIAIVTIMFFSTSLLLGQDSESTDTLAGPWTSETHLGSQFSQAYFENWAQGGQRTWAAGAFFNSNVNYEDESQNWDNQLQMALGFVNTEQFGTQKNEDRIEFNSKYGRKINKRFNYAALLDFKTQFIDGFDLPNDSVRVSTFLAPAWLNISAGLDYKPFPGFNLYYSPIAGRVIIVNDQQLADEGAFGADPGEIITPDLGSYLVASYKRDLGKATGLSLLENISYDGRLELFLNYTPPNPDDIKNVDMNWRNQINMKVNEYISLNFMLHLIYDDDVLLTEERVNEQGETEEFKRLAGLQIMQTLGVGVSVKF